VDVAAKATQAGAVLAVGLGRGGGGKSTALAELVWRAQAKGRDVIIADADARSRTLSGLFPGAVSPESEEMPDGKAFLSGLLNRMAKEKRSAVLDLGGGDRLLLEYGRDLRLVEFCERFGIEPVAVYCLGPDPEDLRHVVTLWDGEFFRPKRAILLLNEGVIRAGQTTVGAFERTMASPDFERIVKEGAVPLLFTRLPVMDQVRSGGGFYAVQGLDPVESFMVESWGEELEARRAKSGVAAWLP
jgi:hypothetical protein